MAQEKLRWEPFQYAAFFPDDLQFIVSTCCQYGTIENGGSLFGSKTHGDNIVIMLALGPGPKASRGRAHFEDDPDFIMAASQFLFNNYGWQYEGNYHCHHVLGLASPSSVDSDQVQKLAVRNNYSQLIQLVITYEAVHQPAWTPHHFGQMNWIEAGCHQAHIGDDGHSQPYDARYAASWPLVRINVFGYFDAQARDYKKLKIKLLKGSNPLRKQLHDVAILQSPDTMESFTFPLDHVLFDEFQSPADHEPASPLPEKLHDKLLSLPEEVLAMADISLAAESLHVAIPISPWGSLQLVFATTGDCPILDISLDLDCDRPGRKVKPKILRSLYDEDLLTIYGKSRDIAKKASVSLSGR